MIETTLPHVEGSEKFILSSFMKEPGMIAEFPLSPDAFFFPAHRLMYVRIAEEPVFDLTLFVQSLHDRGDLDAVGGPSAVTDVYTYAVGPLFERHFSAVLERQRRRKFIVTCNAAAEAAFNCTDPDYLQPVAAFVAANGGSPEVAGRIAGIASRSIIKMADYEHVEPHNARSLLPKAIWRDILREGCLAILGGESKAKKSWFSLAMVMHAVAGLPFLGIPMEEAEEPRRAVVLDYELTEGNIMSRFVALAEKFGDDSVAWRAIWDRVEIRCHRSFVAEAVDWIDYCCAVIRDAGRGDLVIVDCLQALPTGDVNDPREVRKVLSRLQAAATKSGACVLVVDHFNKSGEAKGKNRLSGSMAKAATPDAILLLESDGRDFITFTTELRMDLPRDPMTLEFRTASEGFRVVDSEEREERKEAAKGNRESERLGMLFPDITREYTKQELADNIGKTVRTAEAWVEALAASVTVKPGTGRNPNLYSRKS